jgi:HPr kinase/phosphorylase
MSEIVHATCIAIDGRGILLLGAPGSGKSDLALRLIDKGAELVSDDGTVVEARGGRLYGRCGPHIAGKLEVRGLGILDVEARVEALLVLALALDQHIERLPHEPLQVRAFDGIELPVLALKPFEASTVIKVHKALMLYGLTS